MHVTYFRRPRLYKLILGMAVLCVLYIVFCLLLYNMLMVYIHKKQGLREFRPGYGQDTRSLISYTSLKFLSVGRFLLDWAHNSVQKYDVLSNISQATHLLVQFTSGHIESQVPCPYTMHGAQCLHARSKGCCGDGCGRGG